VLDSVETSARTAEEAITLALQRLGKKRDEVEIEVLSEGSRGILGIGAEDARVRVRLRPLPPPPPPPAPERPVPGAQPPREGRPAPLPEIPGVSAEASATAKQVVEEMLPLMGVSAGVTVRGAEPRGVRTPDDGTPTCTVDVTGEDLGMLIGRRGETLSALQFITNMIVSRRTETKVRVVVDVEHYLVRRYDALRGLALRMAERVRQHRQPVTLEPMPPHERRIIHVTLADHPDVTTVSVGEGEDRKVVISLRK